MGRGMEGGERAVKTTGIRQLVRYCRQFDGCDACDLMTVCPFQKQFAKYATDCQIGRVEEVLDGYKNQKKGMNKYS